MVDWEIVSKLMNAFPDSFVNQQQEFIAHRETNQYFILKDCNAELDVKCKVLEWLSRAAYKTAPFGERKNRIFHAFMLDGINSFLCTGFTAEEMELIYTYLGNACNHTKTVRFVESGYDMEILAGGEQCG